MAPRVFPLTPSALVSPVEAPPAALSPPGGARAPRRPGAGEPGDVIPAVDPCPRCRHFEGEAGECRLLGAGRSGGFFERAPCRPLAAVLEAARSCLRRFRSRVDPEDLAQEVLVEALEGDRLWKHGVRDFRAFLRWVRVRLRRRAIDALRADPASPLGRLRCGLRAHYRNDGTCGLRTAPGSGRAGRIHPWFGVRLRGDMNPSALVPSCHAFVKSRPSVHTGLPEGLARHGGGAAGVVEGPEALERRIEEALLELAHRLGMLVANLVRRHFVDGEEVREIARDLGLHPRRIYRLLEKGRRELVRLASP